MKKVILAAVLALGLLAATGSRAEAQKCGTWGIGPGAFSINLGLNVQWTGVQFGHFPQQGCYGQGGQGGPCYGQPAMYNAYGYGGYPNYGYGYGYGH